MLRGFQLAGSHRFAADSLADPQYAGQNSLVQWKANPLNYEKHLIVRQFTLVEVVSRFTMK